MNVPIVNKPIDTKGQLTLLTPCERNADIKVIIGSHSHCGAIFEAMAWSDSASNTAAIIRKFGIAGLRGKRDSAYWSALVALAKGRTIAVCWHGSQQYLDFVFANTGEFDFYCNSRPNDRLIEGAQLVPEEVIRAHLRPSLSDLVILLANLRAASAAQIILLGTPAVRGEENIRSTLMQEPGFAPAASSLGLDINTIPLTRLSVRVKLWAVIQDLLKEIAEAHADIFVPAPHESLLANGGLEMQYWSGDVTHANHEYGSLMLKSLAEVLAT
jgi:hypothetical protein